MNFAVKVKDTLSGALEKLRVRLGDLRPLWPQIANEFYRIEREQFASEGSRSNAWRPLTAQYRKYKAVRHPGKPILQATGSLRASLVSRNNPNAVYQETARTLTIGSSHPLFAFHQKGTNKMPARPPIDLTAADHQAMADIARVKLTEQAEGLGFRVVGFAGFGG